MIPFLSLKDQTAALKPEMTPLSKATGGPLVFSPCELICALGPRFPPLEGLLRDLTEEHDTREVGEMLARSRTAEFQVA